MEEKIIEQLETEPEVQNQQPENSESSIYGKFKDAQTLLEAYNSLQAEFTRKSQKLADFQKQLEENAVFSKSDSLEEILTDSTDLEKYKKEVTEILDNNSELSNLPNKNFVADFGTINDITYDVEYSIFNKTDIMYSKENVSIRKIVSKDKKAWLVK